MSGLAHQLAPVTRGLEVTLAMSFLAFVVALGIGTAITLARISPVGPLRALGTAYVEVLRNTPLLVLLILAVFALPEVGLTIPLFTAATATLGLYEASFVAEVLRSGVNTVSPGEAEAARALGLRPRQLLAAVVLPQAVRAVVQPLGSVLITLVLNSSLAAAVGVVDLTGTADRLALTAGDPLAVFVGIGVAYFLLTLGIGQLAGLAERRVRRAG